MSSSPGSEDRGPSLCQTVQHHYRCPRDPTCSTAGSARVSVCPHGPTLVTSESGHGQALQQRSSRALRAHTHAYTHPHTHAHTHPGPSPYPPPLGSHRCEGGAPSESPPLSWVNRPRGQMASRGIFLAWHSRQEGVFSGNHLVV